MLPLFAFGALAFSAIGCAASSHHKDAVVALTSNGPIIGHAASNSSEVIEFLGIPYAQPPVGSLRFAAPQKYTGNSTLVASQFGPTCPQTAAKVIDYPDETPQGPRIIAAFTAQLNHTQSEDCLSLNIWTKPKTAKLKPVLIFIHGGRFTGGESNTPFYTGKYIAAREDVVLVTLNYRTNIWGFPGAPEGTKNVAFLDQRLAVEWLRDNIAAFGGDASKIVVFGHSAGGWAIDAWSYTWAANPIISGFVAHSGNVFSFPISNASTAASRWYNVSAQVGCGGSGNATLECMRTKDWTAIKAAVANIRLPAANSQGRSEAVFQPTQDDATVFSLDEYTRRAHAGEFAKIPSVYGNAHFEAGYYRLALYGSGGILTDAQWDRFNLVTFTCPNTFAASARARHGVPAWQFRYGGDWDNTRLYPNSSAYHGTDLHMVFGVSADVSGIPDEEGQRELQRLVGAKWTAFAEDAATGLGWPEFGNVSALIELGFNKSTTPSFVSPQKYAEPCAALNLSWYDV